MQYLNLHKILPHEAVYVLHILYTQVAGLENQFYPADIVRFSI